MEEILYFYLFILMLSPSELIIKAKLLIYIDCATHSIIQFFNIQVGAAPLDNLPLINYAIG